MGDWINLDGLEGGGQILRSALSLSMHTGKPFRIVNIRARRIKPGLLRQHLVSVQAAAAISGAEVEGAEIGSRELQFSPGQVRGGDYRFAIGTAGSCSLVFQTVLPALLGAATASRVEFFGGTHNSMAPPFDFLERAFLPLLRRMGANITLELKRTGFFPAGGGAFIAHIEPAPQLLPLVLEDRGALIDGWADSLIAGLPGSIAARELAALSQRLKWGRDRLRHIVLPRDQGPGNALLLTLVHDQVTEVFTGFGEKGISAETVAEGTVHQAVTYLASGAAAGPYLADQLLLPLAIAGGGSFTASELSQHTLTNAEVIRQFLPVNIQMVPQPAGGFLVTIGK